MRTWFESEEAEEFEAAKDLLIRRCMNWAEVRGLDADPFVVSAALDFRHGSVDGRLSWWTPGEVRRLLLEWIPRRVAAEPEELKHAPAALRTLIEYLDATGLLDPRGATVQENLAAIDEAAREFPAALRDPARQGLATFWARTALRSGVDLSDETAMRAFTDDVQAGRVDFDEDALDRLLEARLSGVDEPERAFAQPPVCVLPDAELAEAADRVVVVDRLRVLAGWAGKEGRALTAGGDLTASDARELVELLGTGDGVRGSAELPVLSLLLTWAKKARLVRVSKGRLYLVAKAAPLLADPLALWRRAFETVFDLREAIFEARAGRPSIVRLMYLDILPDVLNGIYGLEPPVPVCRLAESVWLSCEEMGRRADVDADFMRLLEFLAGLGAVELTEGMPHPLYSVDLGDEGAAAFPPEAVQRLRKALRRPGTLVRLTGLGVAAVRARLVARGGEAGLVGELVDAPPAGLLGVISEHYTPETGRAEISGWLAAHGGDVEPLLEAVRTCPFRGRTEAMLGVLVEAVPDGEALLRRLRDDPVLAPVVLTRMVDEDPGKRTDLSAEEALLAMTESILAMLEVAGPDMVRQQLTKGVARGEVRDVVAAVLDSRHPDTDGLREFAELVAEPALAAPIDGRERRRVAPGAAGRPTGRGNRRKRRR